MMPNELADRQAMLHDRLGDQLSVDRTNKKVISKAGEFTPNKH
jgi:hypothetical protein